MFASQLNIDVSSGGISKTNTQIFFFFKFSNQSVTDLEWNSPIWAFAPAL